MFSEWSLKSRDTFARQSEFFCEHTVLAGIFANVEKDEGISSRLVGFVFREQRQMFAQQEQDFTFIIAEQREQGRLQLLCSFLSFS